MIALLEKASQFIQEKDKQTLIEKASQFIQE